MDIIKSESGRISGILEGLTCPGCEGALVPGPAGGECRACGSSIPLRDGRIPDYLRGDWASAEAILGWPREFVERAAALLPALRAGQAVSSEELAELEAQGLATSDQRLTRLGRNLAYHLAEYRRQAEGDFIEGPFLDLMALDQNASVLDVGAGAGQTLRLLGRFALAKRVGLDVDLDGLAFGVRLVELGDEPIRFVRASATALPFPEGRFSHVISRVTLNLVPQGQALREMARVLMRGGILYCRAEGPGGVLRRLAALRNPFRFLMHPGPLYDFAHGAVLALSGRQLTLGTLLPEPGGVVFATARNITRTLEGAGCEIIRIEKKAGPLGFAQSHLILARKHDGRS